VEELMKKIFLISSLVFMMFSVSGVFASQMDYITNNSPEYLKNPAGRNAATNSADAAANNPAGTRALGDGLYVNLSNQIILKEYAMIDKANDGEYESFKTDPILPNLYLVFNPKGQDWNLWSHIGVLGGGGGLVFPEGGPVGNNMLIGVMAKIETDAMFSGAFAGYFSGTTNPAEIMPALQKYNFDVVQSSVQICQSLGSSYAITKDLTVAAGIRFVESKKKNEINYATGGASKDKLVDIELNAWGVGGIISVNYKPLSNLNLALTYESVTKLEYDVESKMNGTSAEGLLSTMLTTGIGYEDGKKMNIDMPHRIIFGASYEITKDFVISACFHGIIRAGGVDMEKGTNDSSMIDVEKFAYEVGTGFDWQIAERINWGFGFTYDCINAKEEYFRESTFKPDLFVIGTGLSFKIDERLSATLAVSQLLFFDTENDNAKAYSGAGKDLKFTKIGTSVGVGVQYKFL